MWDLDDSNTPNLNPYRGNLDSMVLEACLSTTSPVRTFQSCFSSGGMNYGAKSGRNKNEERKQRKCWLRLSGREHLGGPI